MNRPDFQQTLRNLAHEPFLRRLTSSLSVEKICEIAADLANSDPYGEADFIRAALARIGASNSLAAVYEHQLWCAWRETQWATNPEDSSLLDFSLEGSNWIKETIGFPTTLLMPMTLCLSDALGILRRVSDSRPFVIYGEGMDQNSVNGVMAAGDGLAAVRNIKGILAQGGLFCTYPDFVYSTHASIPIRMFGAPRPISSGFITIVSSPGTLILPAIALRERNAIKVHIDEPFQIPPCPQREWRSAFRQQLAEQCAGHLESLIRRAPCQWLLLNTLTFESPQSASVPKSSNFP